MGRLLASLYPALPPHPHSQCWSLTYYGEVMALTQLWWTGRLPPTSYKPLWRGLDVLKLQYCALLEGNCTLKPRISFWGEIAVSSPPLAMPSVPSQCWTPLSPFFCISFSFLSCSLSSLGPVSPTMGEDREKVCSFLADSGPEGRCHSSPLLYEVTNSCQSSRYVLSVSCLSEEINGSETCIDVHVIITRPAMRTPAKDQQRCCHKKMIMAVIAVDTTVRWVIGSVLESINFFLHAWTVFF